MEIRAAAFIFLFFYTAYGSPTDDFDMGTDDMQNDNDNYDGNYEDAVEAVEEKKRLPETPLEIKTLEEEFVRNLGEEVVLPCVITGSNNYVQVWRKNDAVLFQSDIKMAATSNMKLLKNGSLAILNLHAQDAGEYECKAMDTKQNSPSIQHKVILRGPPKIDLLVAKDNITLLKNGDTLILTCRASGFPKPVISWHKGSNRFDIQGEVLEIPNVKHHHAGTYKCLADNKIGEPAFSSIDIKVEYRPIIVVEKLIVSSVNNSETELECLVHSEPQAQVTWFKDEMKVVSGDRIRLVLTGHKHNLILKGIRDSDFGVYSCLATNSLGSTRKNISLVATPAIYHFTKTQTDAKVVLTWQVQSKSNISAYEVLYRKKEDRDWKTFQPEGMLEVNLSGNDIYEVKYILHKGPDPGEYHLKFRAQNHNGWAERPDIITIEVFAKNGHHKPHKKGHKHGKERQVTPTPTLPSQPDVPAEHQEKEFQSGFIKESSSSVPETTGSSSVITPRIQLLSIALFTIFQMRLASMRI